MRDAKVDRELAARAELAVSPIASNQRGCVFLGVGDRRVADFRPPTAAGLRDDASHDPQKRRTAPAIVNKTVAMTKSSIEAISTKSMALSTMFMILFILVIP
jgi:hypothetical protein